jgi:hypothetical protein
MLFLGRVYVTFITCGAGLGSEARSMSSRYHQATPNLPGKAVTQEVTPRFPSGPLEVNVIFTDVQSTAAALNFAQSFARELGARISLRAAVAVPFQLPLDQPHISVAFLQDVMRKLVAQLEKDTFEPTVHLYFCRDRVRALSQVLRPNSVVVIAGRRRWWPTAETRMARALRAEGHRVIFVDSRARSASERPVFEQTIVAR